LPQLEQKLEESSFPWVPQFAQNFAKPSGLLFDGLGSFSDLPDNLLPLNFLVH